MLIDKNWYSVGEAMAKYGLEEEELLRWVDEGVVRSEQGEKGAVLINGDDLELKIAERSETL